MTTLPTPYYDADGITLYLGDCREILPLLPKVDLVLTDPPYGINLQTDYQTTRLGAFNRRTDRNNWRSNNHQRIVGDESVQDISFLNSFLKLIVWGGQNFADQFENSYAWLVWDKKCERASDTGFSDCELAYTKGLPFKSVRIFRHMWMGYQRDSQIGEKVLHPTEKPLELMRWCLNFVPDAKTILDPFCGSGTTLRAAKDLGRCAIGIEINEAYCKICIERLRQQVLNLA